MQLKGNSTFRYDIILFTGNNRSVTHIRSATYNVLGSVLCTNIYLFFINNIKK